MGVSLRRSRYRSAGWKFLDTLTCILMIPFQHIASLTISVFIFTCFDDQTIFYRLLRYVLIGPLMILLSLLLLPFGALGYTLWMLINALADVQPFRFASPEANDATRTEERIFSGSVTICSANICLPPEHIGRINNQRNVYWRLREISKRLLIQDSSLNKPNLISPVLRDNVVVPELPDVDVFILQEVFNRFFGYQLHRCLRHKYPYCLYDVGCHTFLGNHGALGSGLFLASRYPVLNAEFCPFTSISGYARVVNLGVLIAKLDLGIIKKNGRPQKAIGYVATLHAQAFQGPYKVIVKQLQEAENFIEKFISDTLEDEEVLVHTVLGGDFNCDNMSPGDTSTQNLSFWNRYRDPCREHAGEDKPWTVGTEFRQTKMNHPSVQDRHALRKIFLNDVERRHFILDANVVEQTLELMTCAPKPDADGNVTATETGGRRRIDYLTCHEKSIVVPTGYWFSTVIAGLTDHIPVILMLESTKCHYD